MLDYQRLRLGPNRNSLANPQAKCGEYGKNLYMKEQQNRRPSVPSSSGVHVYGSGSVNKGAEGAKNLWVWTGCHWDLNICTYNAPSLSSDDRMIELEEEISRIKWNIIGLSKVRRKGKGSIILNNTGHKVYYSGSDEQRHGVRLHGEQEYRPQRDQLQRLIG